jgi:hypothetical protein
MKMMGSLVVPVLMLLTSCGGGGGGKKATPMVARTKSSESVPEQGPSPVEKALVTFTTKRKTSLEDDFSNFEDFKENINTHILRVEVTSGTLPHAKVRCKQVDFNQSQEVFESEFDPQGLYSETALTLKDSDRIDISFTCKIVDKGLVLETLSVDLKKSFIIKGLQSPYSLGIQGSSSVDTLVFDEGSVLYTSGLLTSLTFKNLISKNGKVVTFTEEMIKKSIDNMDGFSSQMINIMTQKASGSLQVELRGQPAGDQRNIPGSSVKFSASLSEKGLNPRCLRNYHAGPQGAKGLPGLRGYNGGDSGNFIFRVLSKTRLKLNIQYFPGKASDGGQGGEGFPGGEGSKKFMTFGNPTEPIICPAGPQGPQGFQGDQGEAGSQGKILESQILLGDGFMKTINTNWSSEE